MSFQHPRARPRTFQHFQHKKVSSSLYGREFSTISTRKFSTISTLSKIVDKMLKTKKLPKLRYLIMFFVWNMKKMQKLHNFQIWNFFTKFPQLAENFSTPRGQKQLTNEFFFCFLTIYTKKRRTSGSNLCINYEDENSAYFLHICLLELKVRTAPNTKTNKLCRFCGDFVKMKLKNTKSL